MAGGLFAINSEFFKKLGTYDSGMDIWGGENLELSFKTWMCGGTLETIPCSHVGHVFRKRSPYKWNVRGGVTNVLKRNLVRLAEVWLDDFKEYYYSRIGHDLVSVFLIFLILLVSINGTLLTHSHTMTPFGVSGKEVFFKTLWEKEKMLVTSIFSFSHNVFYSIKDRNYHLCYISFVVCKCFQFGQGQIFVVWE